MPGYQHMSRRDFVTVVTAFLGSVMGAIVGLPAIGYLLSPALRGQKSDAWVPLGPLESYPIDTPTAFSFTRSKVNGWEKTVNSYGAYVIRGSGDEVTVLSNTCTHLSCRVTWKEDRQVYFCPCHDATFSKDGTVLSGPPPRPLDAYETKIEDGNLFIRFVEG
ncbi:MAG: ubiquinol-cytochrome c reductase iron-sulfur subunit [Anaerolineales bacterium]|nr:ubiquinol-cytochrome c reductase iron-sulfur subunit [Anaerolineales bacterium]